MTPESTVPRISRAIRAFVYISYALFALGSVGLFTWLIVRPAILSGVPPATWSWTTLALFGVPMGGFVWWMGAVVFGRFSTTISSAGVGYITVRGRRSLAWADVRRIELDGSEIQLFSRHDRKISVR